MKQSIGALLVLVGAIMFHIASSDMPRSNVSDIWDDFKKVLQGTV